MNCTIEEKLTEKAYEATTPFCYHCYVDCPTGVCPDCQSDDLMRHLPGVGTEYGVEWAFKYLLKDIVEADTDSVFAEMVEGCYGETTKIGFLKVGVVQAMKLHDPIAWRTAKDDYIDSLVEDGILACVDDRYYRVYDMERRL